MIIRPEGQDKLTGFFENAVRGNTLGHAYIIEGDEGSGKRTLAMYFAALCVCESGSFCGECKQCKQTVAGANPDIITVSAEGKSSLTVDKVRDVTESLALRSFHGGRRVIIIEDADLMTVQAQNALLKSIEEPPMGTVFLLLCRRASFMLSTIISRTQVLKMAPVTEEILRKIVPGCTDFEYSYCEGNVGKLIRLSEDKDFKQFRTDASELILKLFTGEDSALYDAVDFFDANKDRKGDLMSVFTLIMRDVFCKKTNLQRFVINTDMPHVIDGISAKCQGSDAAKALIEILESESAVLSKYANYAMAVQSMLIRCKNVINKQEEI